MSTTPEYGEEKLLSGREQAVEERSRGASPPEETEDELEVGERAREDRELGTIDPEDNEAHAPGQVCERCGQEIAATQDARRLPDGGWVHEECPDPTRKSGQFPR